MAVPGDNFRAFTSKSFRIFAPVGTAVALALALTVVKSPFSHTSSPPVTAVQATPAPTLTPPASLPTLSADAMASLGARDAARRMAEDFGARPARRLAPFQKRVAEELGIPNLDRMLAAWTTFTRENMAAPHLGPYAIGDTAWTTMALRYAKDAGFGDKIDGITMDADGKLTVRDIGKFGALLDLRNNPEVATGIYARWMVDEFSRYTSKLHLTTLPPPSMMVLVALFGADAAPLVQQAIDGRGPAPLVDQIALQRRDWRHRLLPDDRTDAEALQSVVQRYNTLLGEAFTSASYLHLDGNPRAPARTEPTDVELVAIAGRATANLSNGTDAATRLLAAKQTIDAFRNGDRIGGIYGIDDRQWLAATRTNGPASGLAPFLPDVEATAAGIEAESPAHLGAFLRLRDNVQISTPILMDRMADLTQTMKEKLGRDPSIGETTIAHLFGTEAAFKFVAAADANLPVPPELLPGPSQMRGAQSYLTEGTISDLTVPDARALRHHLDTIGARRAAVIREDLADLEQQTMPSLPRP